MKTHIVVDLDGTLADVEHRRRFITGKKKDWKKFHEECVNDPPNEWCVRLILAMRIAGCKVEVVSARSQEVEALTRQWLERTFAGDVSGLNLVLLRAGGSFAHDVDLKRGWLRRFGKERILFAVDDRRRVVDMWREEGLVCLQCDDWEEREAAAEVGAGVRAAEDRPA